eukprot:jgi/Chrzof1/9231/Cz03g40230.t1
MGHGSHVSDNDPEVLEREKQRNLKGQTPEFVPGVPGWNPKLASDSEAAVKAERGGVDDMSIEQLQKHTVEVIDQVNEGGSGASTGAHDPSKSPSIRDNLEKSKAKAPAGSPK